MSARPDPPAPDGAWARLKELVAAALERSPDRRAAFVRAECGGDAELLGQVRALLEAHEAADDGFLDAPLLAGAGDDDAGDALVGRRIGGFAVQSPIATGGMGAVYCALQERTGQTVALKVMRAGIGARGWRERFEHEVRILGQLQHPAIARIFDAGVFADDRGAAIPWFAMELVDGLPLTRFVAENELGPRDVVQLMVRVCEGVHHAHQRGVIHRDLKPDNLFVVGEQTGDRSKTDTGLAGIGHPKILDFGIARATDAERLATTGLTEAGQLLGTIAYMSPEQLSGDPDAIDTRSDVYALGVILFEALAGRRPYDLSGRSLTEAARIIQEQTPPRLGSIDRRCAGDLETIVAVALEKDRERRYASASELAADLRRALNDEPIAARPASAFYQLRKFARRHRGLVAGLAAALLAVVAGGAGTMWGWWNAARAASDAETVTGFLEGMVASADVGAAGRRLTVRELLDANAPKIEATFPERPEVRRRLHAVVGWDYLTLGAYDPAARHLREALQLSEQLLGPADARTIGERTRYCEALLFLARTDEAGPLIRENVAIARRHLGWEHTETRVAESLRGDWHSARGEFRAAERIYRAVLAGHREHLGAEHEHTLAAMVDLGNALTSLGRYAEAAELHREVYDVRLRLHGPDHARTVLAMGNVALALSNLGEHAAAIEKYETAVPIAERLWGADHPNVRDVRGNYAAALHADQQFERALAINRELYEQRRAHQGEDHPDTLLAMHQICVGLLELGRSGEARPWAEKLLRQTIAAHGEDHIRTGRALEISAQALAASLPDLEAEDRAATLARCREQYERAVGVFERQLGARHPDTMMLRNNYGVLLLTEVSAESAVPVLRRVTDDWTVAMPDAPDVQRVLRVSLARALQRAGELAEAERELIASWQLEAHPKASDHKVAERLVEVYEAQGQHEQAAEWRRRLAGAAGR